VSRAKAVERLALLFNQDFDLLLEVLARLEFPAHCEGQEGPCQHTNVSLVPGRTRYEWDGEGRNPNGPVLLCPDCAAAYNEHWDGMWADYYAGLI